MKVSQEYAESLAEVYLVLNTIEKKLIDKIPQKLLTFIKENKSNEYKTCFNAETIFLKEQLKPKTRQFLAYLYYTYWCNELEKADYEKKLKVNEIEHQQKIKEKYCYDNLFKDKKIIQTETVKQDMAVVEYKESVIVKLLNKIKKFLK